MSFTLSVPVRLPGAVGVKVTEIAQLAPAPRVLGDTGQFEVCPKLPEAEILEIVSGTVWLFFRVTLFAVLVVFITWLAKARLAGDKLTATVPVPLNCAVCGVFGALSLTVSVPVRVPSAVGVNLTEIAQLAPAASIPGVIGQVEVCPKSPEAEMLPIVSGTVWVFFRVMVLAVLVL